MRKEREVGSSSGAHGCSRGIFSTPQNLLLAQVASLQAMLYILQSLRWLGCKSLGNVHFFGKSPSRCPLGGQSPEAVPAGDKLTSLRPRGPCPWLEELGAGKEWAGSPELLAPSLLGCHSARVAKPAAMLENIEFCQRNKLRNYGDKIRPSPNLPLRLKFSL